MYEYKTSSHLSVQAPKTKLRLDSEVLESVKEKLIELQEREDTEVLAMEEEITEEEVAKEETMNELENGIVVARNISLKAFLNYKETGLTVNMRLLDGKVIIHEVPLGSHGALAGEIVGQMKMWYNDLIVFGERDVIVDMNSVLRSDGPIQPYQLPRPSVGQACDLSGWTYPTVVVEVGLSERLESLHSLTRRYFSARTTIQEENIFPESRLNNLDCKYYVRQEDC